MKQLWLSRILFVLGVGAVVGIIVLADVTDLTQAQADEPLLWLSPTAAPTATPIELTAPTVLPPTVVTPEPVIVALADRATAEPDEAVIDRRAERNQSAPTSTPVPTRQGAKPTSTPRPTATPKPTRTPTITPTPYPVTPGEVNGVRLDQFLIMPDNVRANVRTIFAAGQKAGLNARAFSTAGDSTIERPYFMGAFDTGKYNLGGYAYLQPAIDYYAGSFARDSVATRVGQHAHTMLNPVWADKTACNADESPLACEFRLNKPAIVIIRLGVNDAGIAKLYTDSMRKIIEYTVAQGVIPILSTKPDARAGTEGHNDILRALAAEYQIPLWDYEVVAKTLPGRGLGPDGAHNTGFWQNDYRLPQAYERGHAMQSITALMVLDQVRLALNP